MSHPIEIHINLCGMSIFVYHFFLHRHKCRSYFSFFSFRSVRAFRVFKTYTCRNIFLTIFLSFDLAWICTIWLILPVYAFHIIIPFLAHLSRRLTGELIVYPCSVVRPSSSVRRPSSVVHNFKDLLL